MDAKQIAAALEQLEKKHAKATAERSAAIEAAHKEVGEARQILKDATDKVAHLQHDHLNASFAYDAERADLEKKLEKAKGQEAA